MKLGIFIFLLVLALILEGTIFSIPFVWVVLLGILIIRRDEVVFILGFVAGIILDTFTLHSLGESSSILMVLLFLLMLYERKFEITSLPFMSFAAGIGGMLFMVVLGETNILFGTLSAFVLGGILFFLARFGEQPQTTVAYPARGIHAKK